MPETRISIVIPTYGRAQYLTALVDSVRKSTPKGAYEIIVVSSDPPETEKVKWLAVQPDVVLVQADIRRKGGRRKRSLYYYTNLGIKRAKSEWIFVTNDDMEFLPEWYVELTKLLEDPRNKDVGMVIVAMKYDPTAEMIWKIGRTKKRDGEWKDICSSDLSLIRKVALDQMGLFDEKIDWVGSGADNSLAIEFLTDWRTLLAPTVRVDHFVVAENRNAADGLHTFFFDFHYILRKWRKWCRRNGCDFELEGDGRYDGGTGAHQYLPYTWANRLKIGLLTNPLYTRLPEPVRLTLQKIKRLVFGAGKDFASDAAEKRQP